MHSYVTLKILFKIPTSWQDQRNKNRRWHTFLLYLCEIIHQMSVTCKHYTWGRCLLFCLVLINKGFSLNSFVFGSEYNLFIKPTGSSTAQNAFVPFCTPPPIVFIPFWHPPTPLHPMFPSCIIVKSNTIRVAVQCLFSVTFFFLIIFQNCPHGRPTMRHLINLDMLPCPDRTLP